MSRLEDRVRARGHPIFVAYKCSCLILVLLLVVLLNTFITFYPSCSIQTLYVPALNKYLNASTTHFAAADSLIFFDLELENTDPTCGLHYDAVELTLYSEAANKSMAIGNYSVPGFYQGREKKTSRRDVAVATGSVPWQEAAITALSSGAKAVFRVEVALKMKFKNFFWYSGKKRMVVGGKVEVDDSGRNVGKKAVVLVDSGTAPPLRTGLLLVTCLLVYLV